MPDMDETIAALEFLDELLELRGHGLLERDEASDDDDPRFRPTARGREAIAAGAERRRAG